MRKRFLLCGLAAVVVPASLAAYRGPNRNPAAHGAPVAPAAELTTEEQVNIAVYESVYRSVVNINTHVVQYDRFPLGDIASESEDVGSGSVLDRTGHILTNYHVVEGARYIEVTLAMGKRYAARLVGHDALNDIAVLKIDAPADELYPVTLGESTPLKVGQRIYVIGSPFELERTFTTGIVSSLNRTLPSRDRRRVMKSIIQVDAAMNPGNSGGPLLDTRGRVIGMNTAIASKKGESAGVGFAIPVDRIKRIVPELIQHGKVTRPDIGIDTVVLTDDGLLIRTLMPDGPADRAGLRGFRFSRQRQRHGNIVYERETTDPTAADVIIAVDTRVVRTLDDFLSCVEAKRPGEEVILTIVRDGRRMDVAVRLRASEP